MSHRLNLISSATIGLALLFAAGIPSAAASDQIYFPAFDNVTDVLVQKINAETVRIDMSGWYLTEHSLSIALVNRFNAGVPVRLIGDRVAIFESDLATRRELFWLAAQGIPIRLRYHPTWFPEIDHWKTLIFAGQGIVSFGSANFTPFELAPAAPNNYKDETVLLTDDPDITGAIRTKFDQMWHDTTLEPSTVTGQEPPYLKNWDDACALEVNCAAYYTEYPNPVPMQIDTARLEPDNWLPPEIVWGQGPQFNNRVVQEINAEHTFVDLVVYRLTVDNITEALITKFQEGVPVRILIEPEQYRSRVWPEYWLTHANMDKLWAAGIPIKKRLHTGLTHMKTLVTSSYATNASSNFAANWQRDINYFVPSATKPDIYNAIRNRVQAMWMDPIAFTDFSPEPPDTAALASPVNGSTAVPIDTTLVWNRAPFATSFDVYLGTTPGSMVLVANVPAELHNNPPTTYSWTASPNLATGTTYYWQIVSRTIATPLAPTMIGTSATWTFTTGGGITPPGAPANPNPSIGATAVSTTPSLTWTSSGATSYDVKFGTSNPPPQVSTGQAAASYSPATLAFSTTYFWQIVAHNSGGGTPGAVWSFTTAAAPPGAPGSPSPANAAMIVSINTSLTWAASDATSYDVKFGTSNPPPQVSTGQAGASYAPSTLAYNTTYFWQIVAHNAAGATTGAVWSFTTTVAPPDTPGGPSPASGATGVSSNPTLTWSASGATSYDVKFGTSDPPPQVPTGQAGASYAPPTLANDTTYFWQIVAHTSGGSTTGPVWSFTTIVAAPAAPGAPTPANGASHVTINPTLTWSASGATSYDVKVGTSNPPPQVSTGQAGASFTPSTLANDTTYFWQIVAHNAGGATAGPVWSFTTVVAAPAAPGAPAPANGASHVTINPTLTWSASGATSYDVKVGTSNPPPQVSTGQAGASFTPSTLANDATYFWQIVAHNAGGVTAGPVWSFTTIVAAPAAPGAPAPANGASHVTINSTLTWSASGATSYDVKVGTSNPPPQVSTGQAGASFTPSTLANDTTYFWQIVAHNAGGDTAGSVWSFTTVVATPVAPNTPNPPSGTTEVTTAPSLTWAASGATSFDVMFGTSNPPPQVSTGQAGASFTPSTLAHNTTYFWQIVAHNAGGTTTGPVWSFTTTAAPPPDAVGNPTPSDGATAISVSASLTWTSAHATSYDVNFGTTNPPPLVSSGQAAAWYIPPPLFSITTYFWQIVARSSTGTATGPVWSFTTGTSSGGSLRPGDFDGDRRIDVTVYRPSTGGWYVLQTNTNYTTSAGYLLGTSTDVLAPGDYDGDGKTDPAIYRPSTGAWHILESSTNYSIVATVLWGLSTDKPVPGDYDGDGRTDIAVFRPSTGAWYMLRSSANNAMSAGVSWGLSSDLPTPADYDGDGTTDVAVFRPSTGGWYILKSSTNNTSSFGVSWGLSTDVAVPGDYDGDGKADMAVYRPSSGGWHMLKSSANYTSSAGYVLGASGDVAVPGDYDGDGRTDLGVFRPSTGGWQVLKSSSNFTTTATFSWGMSTDVPVLRRP